MTWTPSWRVTPPTRCSPHRQAAHWFARDDGTIRGTDELRDYLEVEFNTAPQLHLEVQHTLVGVDGVTVVYARENGAVVAEVMNLDPAGRIRVARAFFQGLVFPERPRDWPAGAPISSTPRWIRKLPGAGSAAPASPAPRPPGDGPAGLQSGPPGAKLEASSSSWGSL